MSVPRQPFFGAGPSYRPKRIAPNGEPRRGGAIDWPRWLRLVERKRRLTTRPDHHARPLTHDLLANVIEQMGGTISRIEINNLQDHTFFARIHIRQNGHTCEIDSRPSDAIALGIATTVPIYVAEHVLDEVC